MTEARLYRSRSERMIGGVAGGLATYLGVDPVIIRLAFVALAFAGAGVVAYIIAWIVVPEEPADAVAPTPVRRSNGGGQNARIIVGSILIAIGFMLLLDWLIPSIDRFFWPMALIGLGVAVFALGARK
ncbi:MAG TPA: PspC domain-containing protein [Acidimicrobiia bacterium]|nr:PspC domain-containing protein [Acidimicrobiia bacterium]